MKSWLVTGGCGFIGSRLAKELAARGDHVRILDNLSNGRVENAPPGAEIIIGDVSVPGIVSQAMDVVDGCFHLAAVADVQKSLEDWAGCHRTNLDGTINILTAARHGRNGMAVPVVYASSAAVYGANPEIPLSETAVPDPVSAYGVDKLGCEFHARIAWQVYGIPTVGLRIFNAYGPRQRPDSAYSGVISIFADRIASGRDIEIFGDGSQVRDFVYVGDVVRHLMAAMEKCTAGAMIFNVCTGRGTTILELAKIIGELTGCELNISHGPRPPGDIQVSVGDPRRAAACFGFTADVSIREGLACVLAERRN